MGIFRRLAQIIRGNLNETLNKLEKPAQQLDQLVIDMNRQLVGAKKSVASAIADERRLERNIATYREQALQWERRAMLAVRADNDTLARQALTRHQEMATSVDEYEAQLQTQHEAVEKLKTALRALQQKIDDAQRRRNLLMARAKRAEAQRKIQHTMGTIGNTSAFEAFDKMSARIEQIEVENEVFEEMDKSSSPSQEIEEQFQELEGASQNVDTLLAELKQKMSIEEKRPAAEIKDSDVEESLDSLKKQLLDGD